MVNHSLLTELDTILDLLTDYVEAGYRRQRPTAIAAARYDGAAPVALSAGDRAAELRELEQQVRCCTLCPLHQGRTHGVPGIGVLDPLVMVIGEGPGAEEDHKGEPFVGSAGRYLDKWLAAVELSRSSNVYITNIVKCRPPNNRDPLPSESQACAPYLARQIELVRPRAILSVGRVAAQLLLQKEDGIGKLRGRSWKYRDIPLVATYHPSAVLRNDQWRRPVWEDLKRLRELLDSSS
ncbi:MAG: uracil-DNA glycosylase [Spirochaetaceae bacterium]|nr:MAG: uracil-DNA glycosylase [Spirochaetaceae bacterium]